MSRICEVTGKAGLVGNMVSHSNRKTLMKQLPNLQKKRFYIPEEETAIQACLRLDASDATSTRETAALLKLGNRLDCRRLLILTLEEERTIEDKGRKIEVMPLWKWLLGL